MIINYSILGNITIQDKHPQKVHFVIKNLTTGFTSNEFDTEVGFFSFNLGSLSGNIFNNDDILNIVFYATIDGIKYRASTYNVIKANQVTNIKNVILESNPNTDVDVRSNKITDSKYEVTFVMENYTNVLFKLYYKFKDVYKEIDSIMLDDQKTTINFKYSGEYKVIGHVFNGVNYVNNAELELEVNTGDLIDGTQVFTQYVEWE